MTKEAEILTVISKRFERKWKPAKTMAAPGPFADPTHNEREAKGIQAVLIGKRELPCHGQRIRVDILSEGALRRCNICKEKYRIHLVPAEHVSERIGSPVRKIELERVA